MQRQLARVQLLAVHQLEVGIHSWEGCSKAYERSGWLPRRQTYTQVVCHVASGVVLSRGAAFEAARLLCMLAAWMAEGLALPIKAV